MPLQRGTRLGPYQIESPIGAGGMGEVYKATDTRLERTVAIKVLPAHVASDPERKQRFEREAKTVAALSHPHICPVFDVGREGETDFLVMEYLEGETLADRLAKGALSLDQALRYAIEIADHTPLPERFAGDPNRYGVSSDGQRFLVTVDPPAGEGSDTEPELRLILNWGEELKRLVPTP